jgi:transcriptional regulator with XRE-family HTH domain
MTPEKLAQIRKRLGFTQEEMSHLFEAVRLTVSQWEIGFSRPTAIVRKLYRLIEELPEKDAKQLVKWLQSINVNERKNKPSRKLRGMKK